MDADAFRRPALPTLRLGKDQDSHWGKLRNPVSYCKKPATLLYSPVHRAALPSYTRCSIHALACWKNKGKPALANHLFAIAAKGGYGGSFLNLTSAAERTPLLFTDSRNGILLGKE